MTDNQEKELLVDVLKALFGPQLKGKYIVEVRTSYTVDADDKADAIKKAKEHYKNNIDDLHFMATKIEDLINKE